MRLRAIGGGALVVLAVAVGVLVVRLWPAPSVVVRSDPLVEGTTDAGIPTAALTDEPSPASTTIGPVDGIDIEALAQRLSDMEGGTERCRFAEPQALIEAFLEGSGTMPADPGLLTEVHVMGTPAMPSLGALLLEDGLPVLDHQVDGLTVVPFSAVCWLTFIDAPAALHVDGGILVGEGSIQVIDEERYDFAPDPMGGILGADCEAEDRWWSEGGILCHGRWLSAVPSDAGPIVVRLDVSFAAYLHHDHNHGGMPSDWTHTTWLPLAREDAHRDAFTNGVREVIRLIYDPGTG